MAAPAEASILQPLVVLLGVGMMLAFIFHKFKLPSVLAYIFTGVVIGPYGFKLIQDPALVKAMAEIGILFLLFMVGMELSVAKLKQLRFQAPIAGVLQLILSTGFITLALWLLGLPVQLAFLLGSILALSSTAIVLKGLEDGAEMDTVHGRMILGILILQDLSIVPLMTLVPALTQPLDADILVQIGLVLLKAFLFLAASVLLSLKLIPKILDKIAALHHKEVFTLSVVGIGLGSALLTGMLGLSYEAGAFIAGLALSGSVYTRQVVADSRPFRDVFATLFFVSVGLMVNVEFLAAHWPAVFGITVLLMTLKFVGTALAVLCTRLPLKTALWAGLSLFQIGEFSFILLERSMESIYMPPGEIGPSEWSGHISYWGPLLINAIVISMFITPVVLKALPRLLHRSSVEGDASPAGEEDTLADQVIIAGYGPVAKNLVSALGMQNVAYTVIEMNMNTVKDLQRQGVSALFGDVSRSEILKGAHIHAAKILLLTIPDVHTTEVAIQAAKRLNPQVQCVARSRFQNTIEKLYAAGADLVIYEEFETSAGMMLNTLSLLETPVDRIQQIIGVIREQQQRTDRIPLNGAQLDYGRMSTLTNHKIEWIALHDKCHLVGKTLAESNLRHDTGVNVLSIIHADGQNPQAPNPQHQLTDQDVLVVLGTVEQLQKLETLLSS